MDAFGWLALAAGEAGRRSWEMPSRKFVWDHGHWRFRAEQTRTVADQMTHEEARTIMRIANDYDRLAMLADEQLADQVKRSWTRNLMVGGL